MMSGIKIDLSIISGLIAIENNKNLAEAYYRILNLEKDLNRVKGMIKNSYEKRY